MYRPGYFKGKRITVMGLGLLGGIGDIRFLATEGAELTVTDTKRESDLGPSLEQLKDFPNIAYTLGRHDLADFRDRDLVIKAPSTPLDSPYVAEAKKSGIPVTMWAALFCRFAREAGVTIVGITGTRGKTTTTSLVSHVLRSAGRKVIEGGNLRGTSMLSQLSELSAGAIAVLELDSWKLQGFGEEMSSPDIAVFTNFMPDHQNYYNNDMDAYFADKANIFRYQNEGDTLVAGKDLYESARERFDGAKGSIVTASLDDVPKGWNIRIPGEHNRKNVACAIKVLERLDIPPDMLRAGIESFEGVEGRLEFLKESGGVRIYNDTTSTTPDAALAGLEALAKNRNVVLIMGGADKQLNMSKLVQSLDFYCKKIVLLPGTGTDRLNEFGFDAVSTPVDKAQSLEEAVGKAKDSAASGDILLFSPAFASFGLFKNEYDRGDRFKALVEKMK